MFYSSKPCKLPFGLQHTNIFLWERGRKTEVTNYFENTFGDFIVKTERLVHHLNT